MSAHLIHASRLYTLIFSFSFYIIILFLCRNVIQLFDPIKDIFSINRMFWMHLLNTKNHFPSNVYYKTGRKHHVIFHNIGFMVAIQIIDAKQLLISHLLSPITRFHLHEAALFLQLVFHHCNVFGTNIGRLIHL